MKILVVSHNVFSPSSSMGRTLSGFFGNIQSDDIAQLYFYTEVPTTEVCTNYYRITDFELIKKKKKDTGTVFLKGDIKTNLETQRVDTKNESNIYNIGRKKKPYMYIGRNLIWATKKWKNRRLLNWIDEFNPDVIFFASGDYVFSYKIAMEIAEYKKIPIVTYICDDYYFAKRKSFSLLYYINRMQYKRTLKKLFSKHKNIVAICDKITDDYKKEFAIHSQTIMTTSALEKFNLKEDENKIVISYLGNMGYKRNFQLIEIGKAIKEVTNDRIMLDVYSAEKRTEMISSLTEENGIKFHGGISYNEVIEVMKNSDILVHTESFDKVCRDKVRYSVSTKIADSLACGRCLFAYGPNDVASIEYLKENDCACVVTENDNLKESLKELLEDAELIKQYVGKALDVAENNHNLVKNSTRFCEFIEKVVKEQRK